MHEIDAYAPDLLVLAGYMRILSPAFCCSLPGAYAEYPPFPAAKISGAAHREALENGDEKHGTSVHLQY